MKPLFLSTLFIILFSFSLSAQDPTTGHFLVTFEKFSPPVQDLVKSFEGFPAENFLANDINGKEHFLGDYKGKNVILWFWSIENTKAVDQIGALTLLQEKYKNLKIIGFAKETSSKVKEFLRQYPMEIDVIPNGEVFGQMAYGAEMGNPRMFLIDEFGVIKAALPEQAFSDNNNLFISLESILNGF